MLAAELEIPFFSLFLFFLSSSSVSVAWVPEAQDRPLT